MKFRAYQEVLAITKINLESSSIEVYRTYKLFYDCLYSGILFYGLFSMLQYAQMMRALSNFSYMSSQFEIFTQLLIMQTGITLIILFMSLFNNENASLFGIIPIICQCDWSQRSYQLIERYKSNCEKFIRKCFQIVKGMEGDVKTRQQSSKGGGVDRK